MGDGFRGIVRAHREVHRFLREVARAPADEPPAAWAARVGWLRDTLGAHFANEETRGGFFDVLARWVPDGAGQVEGLRRDHDGLRLALEGVARLADAADPGLEAAVRALASRLSAHEAIEAELSLTCERARRAAGDLGA